MTDPTPDPLWDGAGADGELDELQALLAPYGTTSELPPLPRRPLTAPPRWALAVAAALLLAVGVAALLGPDEQTEPDIEQGVQPDRHGGTGAALDSDSESTAAGRTNRRRDALDTETRAANRDLGSPTMDGDPVASPDEGGDVPLRGDASDPGKSAQGELGAAGRSSNRFIFYEDEMALSGNPVHERTMGDVRLNELIHIPLYAPNYADQPRAHLVASEELDSTGRVLTLTLREARWSDGEPVVAADVVFTLAAYKDPASGSWDRHRWDFIVEAKAPDSKTVVLTFDRAYRTPPTARLFLKVLPRHVFSGEAVPYNHSYRTQPVTGGPFTVEQKDHKNWVLKRNPNSLRPSKLREVRAQEVPEKRTQAELMSYRYGHAMPELLPEQRAELDADECCKIVAYPSKSWWYIGANQKNKHLRDPRVRAALNLAVNRQQALDLIGEGELLSGPFTRSSRFYNHKVAVPAPDLEEADSLMSGAGYTKQGPDWVKAGERVALRFFYDESMGEQAQTVATNIVGQLKKFGLDVSGPAAIGGVSWQERIHERRDFDLVLSSWSFDVAEDIGQLFSKGGARNFVGHDDEQIERLLTRAYESQDPSEQQAAMKEVHRRLAETQPYLFLWSPRQFSAVSWDLEGAHLQAFYYFTQLPDWSLKRD